MINHARTLLMNIHPKRANYADTGFTGYEYVPADFVPVRLPAAVNTVRNVIFGSNPDGLFCGLRAQELLSYVHETEFAEYVYALDKRVTYWPEMKEPRQLLDKQKIIVSQTRGDARRLTATGVLSASLSSGVAFRSYSVVLGQQTEDDVFVVHAKMLEPPYTLVTTPVSFPNVPPIVLPQSAVTIKIAENILRAIPQYLLTETENNILIEHFGELTTGSLLLETDGLPQSAFSADLNLSTVIARWQVSTRTKPAPVITTLLPTLEMLGEPVFLELFGVKQTEPYATFKNLWFDHPNAVYRLIGLTLALIYRAEEARKHG
jgi:hypothetical protein